MDYTCAICNLYIPEGEFGYYVANESLDGSIYEETVCDGCIGEVNTIYIRSAFEVPVED